MTKATSKKAVSKKAVKTEVTPIIATLPEMVENHSVGVALTVAMLQASIASANMSYISRTASPVLNKNGVQADFSKAHTIAGSLTDAQLKAISDLQIAEKLIHGLKDASNTKKPMRILQAILFTLTGSGNHLKGSTKTFMLEYCGLIAAKPTTRDALAFCATGKGNTHTSDECKNTANAHKLIKAFGGAVSTKSEKTQNSVSFSLGGIGNVLGVAHKDSRTGIPVINTDNAVTRALNAILEKMTDNQIALIVAQSSEKG